jgi:thymidylate kinase
MLILFCGPDCSGKDSLMHELAKLYDYQYYMSPRSPICNIVYDALYKRDNTERVCRQLNLIEAFLRFDAFFVYVSVNPNVLEARAKARNEKHVSTADDFKKHIAVYKDTIKKCKAKFANFEKRFVTISNEGDIKAVAKRLKKRIDAI